jgi:hypothetical protein
MVLPGITLSKRRKIRKIDFLPHSMSHGVLRLGHGILRIP